MGWTPTLTQLINSPWSAFQGAPEGQQSHPWAQQTARNAVTNTFGSNVGQKFGHALGDSDPNATASVAPVQQLTSTPGVQPGLQNTTTNQNQLGQALMQLFQNQSAYKTAGGLQ